MRVKEGKTKFREVVLVIETKEELEVMTDIFGSMGSVAVKLTEMCASELQQSQFTSLNDDNVWEQLTDILNRYKKV